jgi:hypothetical protein
LNVGSVLLGTFWCHTNDLRPFMLPDVAGKVAIYDVESDQYTQFQLDNIATLKGMRSKRK